jgi:8-oxo-dGTP pyrophosphatase MutT (NUDIX family)
MDNTNDNIFQVSVKGLFFDKENKLMMLQQKDGLWEPPGGRIQKGEEFIESLKRECLEETGLECEVLEQQPFIVYPTIDQVGRGRIMVFYKVSFSSLDFKPSDECVDMKFFSKHEIKQLPKVPQLEKLVDFL